jgi:hypothetical protein
MYPVVAVNKNAGKADPDPLEDNFQSVDLS